MGKIGKLSFKGDKPKKKKTKAKTDHRPAESTTSVSLPPPPAQPQEAQPEEQPQVRDGKGLITTSGTVVTGHEGTQFTKQLSVGDALVVGSELRVVTMCLSDASLNLSSALAQNLTTPTAYQFVRKPRKKVVATAATSAEEDFSRELVYQEKTASGSYRTRREQLEGPVSRGDLLEMRSKKKSDKYC